MSEYDLSTEYGHLRVGSTLSTWTLDVRPKSHAFDMQKLADFGLLSTSQAIAQVDAQGSSFSHNEESADAFATANKISVGMPLFKSHLSYQQQNFHTHADTRSGFSLKFFYTLSGKEISLLENIDEDTLYSCSTDSFKKAIKCICEAQTLSEAASALFDFEMQFGTGFVSTVKLAGRSVVTVSASSVGSSDTDKDIYSGSAGAGGIVGDVSGGAATSEQWASQQARAHADGKMAVTGYSRPAGSAVEAWMQKISESYNNKAFEVMRTAPPHFVPDPEIKLGDPVIPEPKGKPEKTPFPAFKLKPGSLEDLGAYYAAKKAYEEGGYVDDPAEVDENKLDKEVSEQQKKEEKNLKRSASNISYKEIVKPGSDHEKTTKETIQKNISNKSPTIDEAGAKITRPPYKSSGSVGVAALGGDFDYGDYAPIGFTYRAYSDVFPALRHLGNLISRNLLSTTKLELFFMTRCAFGSYLSYVAGFPEDVRNDWINREMAESYKKYLNNLSEKISTTLKETNERNLKSDPHREIVLWFRNELKEDIVFRSRIKIYDYFDDNIDFFMSAPGGFALSAPLDLHEVSDTARGSLDFFVGLAAIDKPKGSETASLAKASTMPDLANMYRWGGADSVQPQLNIARLSELALRFIPVIVMTDGEEDSGEAAPSRNKREQVPALVLAAYDPTAKGHNWCEIKTISEKGDMKDRKGNSVGIKFVIQSLISRGLSDNSSPESKRNIATTFQIENIEKYGKIKNEINGIDLYGKTKNIIIPNIREHEKEEKSSRDKSLEFCFTIISRKEKREKSAKDYTCEAINSDKTEYYYYKTGKIASFSLKEEYESIYKSAYLVPIDHNCFRVANINGRPMWFEIPFQEIKESLEEQYK